MSAQRPPSEPEAPEVDVVRDLANRARSAAYYERITFSPSNSRMFEELAAALEAERDYAQVLAKAGTEWARIANAEREARRQDRETVDAGLRRIGNCSTHPVVHRIARDLLERP